jgi:hypothetical protein
MLDCPIPVTLVFNQFAKPLREMPDFDLASYLKKNQRMEDFD